MAVTLGAVPAATPGTTSVQPGWTSARLTGRPSTASFEPGSSRTVRPSVKYTVPLATSTRWTTPRVSTDWATAGSPAARVSAARPNAAHRLRNVMAVSPLTSPHCIPSAVERQGWYSPAADVTQALHAATVIDRARPRIELDRILHPRSVAVFGASDSKDKFGGRIMSFLVQHGFAGEIYPIN